MANTDRPNGLKPVRYLSGAPWNGQARVYEVPAANSTSIFIGDLVALNAAPTDKYAAVEVAATTTGPVLGVIVGLDPVNKGSNSLEGGGTFDLNLSEKYVPSGEKRFVLVVDDPSVIFEIQEDSAADPLDATDIGLNASFINGTPNTTTGA